MTSRIRNVAAAGALSAAAAAVGGLATDPQSAWYRSLKLPPWQPPSVAFPLVWTGLYASIAGASAKRSRHTRRRVATTRRRVCGVRWARTWS